MSKRVCVAAGVALALLAFAPSIGVAQARPKITAEWENAPLTDVVRAFASYSGRTIVVAPEVGDPWVTIAFRDVDWQAALEIILAAHALVARVDPSGAIRIEKMKRG